MRRFLSFNDFFKMYLGGKTVKLSLDGGFTCPNRDGLISTSGCVFCSDSGSGDFQSDAKEIDKQIKMQKDFLKNKWKAEKYMAYFQNFTNTYGDYDYIENLYENIINRDDIAAISIATRCDCINDKIIDLITRLNEKKLVFLELGLQSTNEDTIKLINRGYSHKKFDEIIKKLDENKIKYLLHIIYGLPGEDYRDFKNTFDYANSLKPFGIKFHNLYITKNTSIHKMYNKNPFKILEKNEYIDLVLNSIENLNDKTVIHRLTGDPDRDKLVEPNWSRDKLSIISSIDKKLKEKNIPIITEEKIKEVCDYWKNY